MLTSGVFGDLFFLLLVQFPLIRNQLVKPWVCGGDTSNPSYYPSANNPNRISGRQLHSTFCEILWPFVCGSDLETCVKRLLLLREQQVTICKGGIISGIWLNENDKAPGDWK